MNSAHVYKRHSFISNDECVRIPEGNIRHDAINHTVTPKHEEALTNTCSDESDDTGINQNATGITDENSINSEECSNDNISEYTEQQVGLKKARKKADPNNTGENTFETDRALDKEALSEIYRKELEELYQSEAERAYFDALTKKKNELRDCISDVQKILDELIQRHEEFIEQYTNELKYMSIDIAEKMLLEKISIDDAVLHKLVLQNLSNVKNAEWISVELSERLVGLVDSVKRELEKPEYKGRVSVLAVTDKEDTCRITTEDGTVVSTISVQADNLRKAFREAEKE